jgi:hypothetical protein
MADSGTLPVDSPSRFQAVCNVIADSLNPPHRPRGKIEHYHHTLKVSLRHRLEMARNRNTISVSNTS